MIVNNAHSAFPARAAAQGELWQWPWAAALGIDKLRFLHKPGHLLGTDDDNVLVQLGNSPGPEGPKLPIGGDSVGLPLKAAVDADEMVGFSHSVDSSRELTADAADPPWNMLWNIK